MDTEDIFGWLLSIAVVGLFFYIFYVALTKDRAQTWKEFRRWPIGTTLIYVSAAGTLLFFLWIASFGKLSFVIPTPWFNIHSAALGFCLGFLPFFIRRK